MESSNMFMSARKTREILGVHSQTLYQWEKKGWIETVRDKNNYRMYNVNKYLQQRQKNVCQTETPSYDEAIVPKERMKIVYARVSSLGQKNDLERQKRVLMNLYPNHFMVEDIGSGINMNRCGFRKMIDWIIEGKIEEVVVMHKDRLARFGYDLFEDLLRNYSKGKIIVVEGTKDTEPEEELAKDVLQIMNIFVAKMNDLRKYESSRKPVKI